jgi:hypothetical protein
MYLGKGVSGLKIEYDVERESRVEGSKRKRGCTDCGEAKRSVVSVGEEKACSECGGREICSECGRSRKVCSEC